MRHHQNRSGRAYSYLRTLSPLFLTVLLVGGGGGGGSTSTPASTAATTTTTTAPGVTTTTSATTTSTTSAATTTTTTSTTTTTVATGSACPTANSAVATAGGIQLGLGASRATGVAPLAVFFDASNTTAASTTRPFHDLEYRWNFGDAGSGTWGYGAKAGTASRNAAMGTVAAHVFESAGTYPITVSAFNGTTTVSYSCDITVTSADAEFAGAKTVCVSGAANFAGCPSGATHVTSANATTAISSNIGAGNKRILFRRGETFTVGSVININQGGPSMVGAFGSGAKPIMNATTAAPVFNISSSATPTGVSDWRFQDISINGNLTAGSAFNGAGSASRFLLHRVDIANVGYGFLLSGSILNGLNTAVPFAHAMWDEFYIVDSTIYNVIPGNGPNAIFASANRMVAIGNSIDNNGGGEHGIRMQLANRAVFSENTIQGIAAGKVNLTIRGVVFAGTSSVAAGTYSEKIIISGNKLVGGLSSGIMGIGPQNGFNDERGRNMIVERNWFVGSSTSQNYIGIAQSDITVRNNLADAPGITGGSFVEAKDEDPNQVNVPTRVNVYNNSFYHGSTGSNYFALFFAAPNNSTMAGSTFDVRNNILYAPSGSSMNMTGNTSSATITSSNNTTNPATSPLFSTNPPTSVTHFAPSVGSYANGAGTNVSIFSDFHGVTTHSPADMGAVAH